MAVSKPDTVVVYKTIGNVELSMHIFFPPNHQETDKTPALVFFHGGAWNSGGPEHFYNQCEYLASRGMVCMSAQYRTKKGHGTSPIECVKDAKSAMRWVKTNAKQFGIDAGKILAGGGSAGGHMAAATATVNGFNEDGEDTSVSCRPKALVLFNPVAHNGPGGFGYNRAKDYYKDFSPYHNLSQSAPPTLIMLGTKDKLFNPQMAKEYKSKMEDLGLRCDLILYPEQEHAFFNINKNEELHYQTMIDADKFLISLGYLKGQAAKIEDLMYGSWRFINLPDYHNAEGLSLKTTEREQSINEQIELFKQMKERHGGELIVMPGDCNGGHWYRQKYLKKFKAHPDYANYNTAQVILEASRLCYEGLWDIVHKGGYENFLMAIGDHELGDNPWKKGSDVVDHISNFRQGFANTFTLNKNGESRFTKNIGNASPRPLGTIYEHTSNAVQYKNVLFVTLDMFRFDAKDKNLGDQGVINGDIAGKHLEWFESVLSDAQNIPSINHIVVQSHLPIIYPVRKYASSGMMVDKKESEKILNVLRKYKVDLYLAGEVHMNTVTKDSKSDLIQLVARGNRLTNMTLVDVENNKLLITTFHQNGDKLGSLSIDKSSGQTNFESTGLLNPLNPKGLQIHWSFDEQLGKSNFKSSIEGAFPVEGKHNPLMSTITKPIAYLNDGGFNFDYSLIGNSATQTKGIIGGAVEVNSSTNLFLLPIGPMDYGYERTLSCWVKTMAKGRRLILNSGSYWGNGGQFFNLGINDGNLELALRPETVTTTQNLSINDGNWHHLAVVMPHDDAKIEDLKLFVDGLEISDKKTSNPEVKVNTTQANWMAIATQTETYKTDLKKTMNMQDYVGLLDDFCLWTRSLSEKEIKQIYSEGLKGMSALEIEKELEK